MRKVITAIAAMAISTSFVGTSLAGVTAKLTTAPNVSPAVKRAADTVVINLEAKEYIGNLADDLSIAFGAMVERF